MVSFNSLNLQTTLVNRFINCLCFMNEDTETKRGRQFNQSHPLAEPAFEPTFSSHPNPSLYSD